MMGGVSLETCWASYKYGIINFDTLLILLTISVWIILWCTDPKTSMLHDVHSNKALSQCHRISRYTLICNFIYAHKKKKVFSAPIFTTLVTCECSIILSADLLQNFIQIGQKLRKFFFPPNHFVAIYRIENWHTYCLQSQHILFVLSMRATCFGRTDQL
jgi:hypothetical protein